MTLETKGPSSSDYNSESSNRFNYTKLSKEQLYAISELHTQIESALYKSGLELDNETCINLLEEIEKMFEFGKVQSEHDRKGDLIINSFVANNWLKVACRGKFDIDPDHLKGYMQSNGFLNRRFCELGLQLNNTLFTNRNKNRDFKREASLLEWTVGCLEQYLTRGELQMFLQYIYEPFLNPTTEDLNKINKDFAWWISQSKTSSTQKK
jgi:hypothetical protein